MNLSKRLEKIAEFVPKNGTVADIGTDHGHLPVFLVKTNKVKKAIAADVAEGPLSRAMIYVKAAGLSKKIETRLSDGLKAFEAGEADTVVIAGMGGALIWKIMEEGKHMWDSVSHWVISPQSEIGEIRHKLAENGFLIVREEMVFDALKYYVVMDVVRGSMKYDNEYEYRYGKLLIDKKDPVLKDVLLNNLKQDMEIISHLQNQSSSKSKARLDELKDEAYMIEEVLKSITFK